MKSTKCPGNPIISTLIALMIVISFQTSIAPQISPNTSYEIDLKQLDSLLRLKDIYSFLAGEYQKITEILMSPGTDTPNPRLSEQAREEMTDTLDQYLARIPLFIFQQAAAEKTQVDWDLIIKTGLSDEILRQIKERLSPNLNSMPFEQLEAAASAYIAWKQYERLVEFADEANLVFREDFESPDLAGWKISGEPKNTRVDSRHAAQGKLSLRLTLDQEHNSPYISVPEILFHTTKICRDWKIFIPEVDGELICNFFICGASSVITIKGEKVDFHFKCNKNIYDFPLAHSQWHTISIISDYQKNLWHVLIDGRIKLENLPMEKTFLASDSLKSLKIYGTSNPPTSIWIDEMRIYYIQ